MGLRLDPACRAALDLAKRSLPDGSRLEVSALIESLYFTTDLKDRYPMLGSFLKSPKVARKEVPAQVPVAESLQLTFQQLATVDEELTPERFLGALVQSSAGRAFLLGQGMLRTDLDRLFEDLKWESAPDHSALSVGPGTGWRDSDERQEVIKALNSFGRMLTLTEPPYKGVVELDSALKTMVRTLSRMGRRNAIITGPPGTGKTALVYELARRLSQRHESIPLRLQDHDVFELSPSFLRSGASMVGQYDQRVKALIEILRAHPKVILFVDEIHSLFKSGMHEKGPFSEANEAFKSVLGRGDLTCIGCTTTSEYRHYLEPDGALTRRFVEIRLKAPSPAATVRILKARLPRLRRYYHPLEIPEGILDRVVSLTEEYLPGRYQPDKSIQLIDEACAYCVTDEKAASSLSEDALWRVLEDHIGHRVIQPGLITETNVLAKLKEGIIGQDRVIGEVTRAFVGGLGSWARTSGPRGVFFFCGPTGVGKTETAALLAKILGAGQSNLVRVDCNTIQGSGHDSGPAMNRLLGAPPGYLGYVRGQGGILSRIRDIPECVVLFDEIEKADPGVAKLLLQILDNGRVEDVDGNLLDFRRSFIVFTTNAGCQYDRRRVGFEQSAENGQDLPQVDLDMLKAELGRLGYGEEFLARISHFFAFQGLGGDEAREIVGIQLERLRKAAELKGYRLGWEPAIVNYLSSQWQPRFGVRHLMTILRNRISEQLGVCEAQGELKGVVRIRLTVLALPELARDQGITGLAMSDREGETLIVRLA